jgi:hypothetical protein
MLADEVGVGAGGAAEHGGGVQEGEQGCKGICFVRPAAAVTRQVQIVRECDPS